MRPAPPPRLAVILARDADEALVFRRGPAAWFQLIRWDTRHDRFDDGAWIRGRIYPEDCDLSPDGRLLVYKVHRGNRAGTSYTDCWTGISRPPWLTALALWPMGTTYGGGGRFTEPRALTLRVGDALRYHHDHPPPRQLKIRAGPAPVHAFNGKPGVDWRGRDRRGRPLYAAAGRLFEARADACADARWRPDPRRDRLLADFNGRTPDPRPAPDWARRPLSSDR